MLVDDNELDNFLSEKIIGSNRFGEQVYVNSSGISALEFMNNLAKMGRDQEVVYPEIIFIDINMPIMDGFQFIRKLREMEGGKFNHSKLVMLTSSIFHEDREKARALGSEIVFLNKPLTAELLDTL